LFVFIKGRKLLVSFGSFVWCEDTHEKEGEKSPFSSPLLPSGRTNERGREKERKWANNNDNDSSEKREKEREIEKKKKERARARAKQKKGLSRGGEMAKRREEILFLYHV
jgi:hypothetical protein